MRLCSKQVWKLFLDTFGFEAVEKEMPATKKIKKRVLKWVRLQRKKEKDDHEKARVS